ncbi:MAG: TIGR02996 domain-containing protein [Gemmataceae bacterium]
MQSPRTAVRGLCYHPGMSHDAFLRAVIADPDDDTPRLVYADWLDEHGDPARAEFIRVQIDLARMDDDDPRRSALEDREHDLLVTNESGWLSDAVDGLQEWDWVRGFVEQITSGLYGTRLFGDFIDRHPVSRWRVPYDFRDDASHPGMWLALPWIGRIRSIDLDGGRWAIDDLDDLLNAPLPSHRELDLSNCPGLSSLAESLDGSPASRRLVSLAFGGHTGPNFRAWDAEHETVDFPGFVRAMADAPLEHLTAFDCGLTTAGLRELLAAPFAPRLKSLDISDNPLAPDGWRAFRQLPAEAPLGRLDVSGTPLAGISLEPMLDAPALGRLTDLEMNRCGSARRNLEVLAASGFWTRAKRLRLHSGTIPASTLEPLCQSAGPPRLQLLDLADNFLRTEGVRLLCDAPWSGSLTWLALSRNYLDDESLDVFARSGRFAKLRTLHLAHNNFDLVDSEQQITDHGVFALTAAPSLSNLRILTLSYTGVTDRCVEAVLNAPHWRLSGLGLGGCDLSRVAVEAIAKSPRLGRLQWLDLSGNPRLSGDALRPLAESPYLSRLCELDIGGVYADDAVRQALRDRLGPRLSE